jgi:hypothetical protein
MGEAFMLYDPNNLQNMLTPDSDEMVRDWSPMHEGIVKSYVSFRTKATASSKSGEIR